MTLRNLPDVPLTIPDPDYARLCAWGWDTWQEAYNRRPMPNLVKRLDLAKAAALELDETGGTTVPFELAGRQMRCHGTGAKGGVRWLVSCDDFMFLIRSPKTDYAVSVRYLAAGLWEHGKDRLSTEIAALIYSNFFEGEGDKRISRADYCFDFYAPTFKQEMVPAIAANVVCHSSCKTRTDSGRMWGRAGTVETMDIGSKKGCQVSIYNKALEITEISGKTWMEEIWAANLDGECPWGEKVQDIWRLEIRMGKDYLKERNATEEDGWIDHKGQLISEPLYTRRLTVPTSDQNRARWPLHPLWSLALQHIAEGREMLPLGHQVTGKRKALEKRAKKQIQGGLRSMAVLAAGDFSPVYVERFLDGMVQKIEADSEHAKKIEKAQYRYALIDEAE